MRHRLASQLVRQSSDVCIFCSLGWTPEISSIREGSRLATRAYTSSVTRRAPAGAAAARKDDDGEEDFPLFKQNAAVAANVWTNPQPADRLGGAPPPKEAEPQQRFSIRGNQQNKPPFSEFGPRRDNRFGSREGQQGRYQDQSSQPAGSRPRRDNRFEPRDHQQDRFGQRSGYDTYRSRMDSRNGSRNGQQDAPQGQPDTEGFRLRKPPRSGPRDGRQDPGGDGPVRRNNEAPDRVFQSHSTGEDGAFTIRRTSVPEGQYGAARNRAFELDKERRARHGDSFGGQGPSSGRAETESWRPQVEAEPPERRQRQDSRKQHHDPLLDEVKKIEVPVAGEAEERERHAVRSRSRFSNRFELEDDVEAELPAQKAAVVAKGSSYMGSARKSSTDFDFDLFEAEQALNGEKRRKKEPKKKAVAQKQKPTLVIPEFMTVQQLAQSMKLKVDDLVKKLEEEGFEGARFDHMLDAETSTMFADIYGFEPVAGAEEMQDLVARPSPEDISLLPPRPPIVTIMGHVDHGKTTILDWLRKSSVAAGEHGGITQHIGAFSVTMPGSERQITFLDTPGHEAFLDMRRRGANVTDIVVLVVAADDSVKPQTIEAIKHALDARVQLIVAINKVDKHDANIDQVKQDLTRHDIVVEDYGGDYQAIAVSGKTGQGMEDLEEAIITLADVLDLRAEQEGPAEGQIIESKVTNAGRVATVLVRRGVLHVGDFIVAGPTWGRVRTLRNDSGQLVQAAYPGDPVQLDGWRGSDPTAGLEVLQADNEQHAKDVIDLRHERAESAKSATDIAALNAVKSQEAEARAKVLAWEAENNVNKRRRGHHEGWIDAQASSGPKPVHFVVKADVAGSVEAIVAAVSAIGNHEVQANVIHSGTGPVTESDIRMLATTGEIGYAISFNQPVEGAVHSLAYAAGLEILDQNIIYRVTEAVKDRVSAALPPLVTQRVLGEAEVGKIFEVTIKKEKIKIAGCKITNGTISRANQVRVIRNGETVYTGTLNSLKNVKKDVTEMRKGTECGLGFKDWDDTQEGDQVRCFEEKEEKRTLY
ncbi:translation initiation factor IF-2 [Exophiala xenobiotica]|uniref:Translation initiation factor IF-2, mitochondrial n=1 Tax=Lithohypha guttulata TaxID=1690604 RepID=A0ABR0KE29_9EURO|nr:translation initiation factor IF-2 [Lithohypha guttulata]KAK5312050.1 translation initiation factor IF-2 [Exophiala xenobiotica]